MRHSSQSPAINVKIQACPYTDVRYCGGVAYLQPNTTYYITMVNRNSSLAHRPAGMASCDMRIDFNK